jgi:hypothetical protein
VCVCVCGVCVCVCVVWVVRECVCARARVRVRVRDALSVDLPKKQGFGFRQPEPATWPCHNTPRLVVLRRGTSPRLTIHHVQGGTILVR